MNRNYLKVLIVVLFLFLLVVPGFVSAGPNGDGENTVDSPSDSNAVAGTQRPGASGGSGSEGKKIQDAATWLKELPFFAVFMKNDGGDINALGEITKLLFLMLVIVFIYSSLSYAKFPESATARTLISLIVGILATILINSSELITILQSYKALGITLILFFPLMILAFFTFAISMKINAMGIVIQRILWLIYSVYLFIRSAGLLLIKSVGLDNGLDTYFGGTIKFLFGDSVVKSENIDASVLVVLLIVSVAVFWVFFLFNDKVVNFLIKEKKEADLAKYGDTAKRAKAAREIDADMTR